MFVTSAYAEEATTAGTAVPVEGGHGGNTFPPFDPTTFSSQLVWLAITFGLFYLFLKKVAMPRIASILDVRSNRIAQDLDQAAKLKGEADTAVAAYEQELAEAKINANSIGQKARDEAKAEADAARKDVEAGLEKKLVEAEARIATIKASAMKDVGAVAETTATAILESLVGKADKGEVAAAVKAAR